MIYSAYYPSSRNIIIVAQIFHLLILYFFYFTVNYKSGSKAAEGIPKLFKLNSSWLNMR